MQLGYPFPQLTPLKGFPHLCKQLLSSYPSAGGAPSCCNLVTIQEWLKKQSLP